LCSSLGTTLNSKGTTPLGKGPVLLRARSARLHGRRLARLAQCFTSTQSRGRQLRRPSAPEHHDIAVTGQGRTLVGEGGPQHHAPKGTQQGHAEKQAQVPPPAVHHAPPNDTAPQRHLSNAVERTIPVWGMQTCHAGYAHGSFAHGPEPAARATPNRRSPPWRKPASGRRRRRHTAGGAGGLSEAPLLIRRRRRGEGSLVARTPHPFESADTSESPSPASKGRGHNNRHRGRGGTRPNPSPIPW